MPRHLRTASVPSSTIRVGLQTATSGLPCSLHKSPSDQSASSTWVTAESSCSPARARHSYLPTVSLEAQDSRSLATVSPRLACSCVWSPSSSRWGTKSPSLYQATAGAGLPVAVHVKTTCPDARTSTLAGATAFQRRWDQRGEITNDSAAKRRWTTRTHRIVSLPEIIIIFFVFVCLNTFFYSLLS